MNKLLGPFNSGLAVGNNGVATANEDSDIPVEGEVNGVYVKYNDNPPAGTTDILITTKGTNAPAETVLAIADAATSGWFYPVTPIHLKTTGAAIANEFRRMVISDYLNIKIDQANANDNIDVWISLGD